MDAERQVAYWAEGAGEDLGVAEALVSQGKIRHGLFFAHLALEKMLKAHVCRATQDVPPRTHNLPMLAERASLQFGETQRNLLAEMERFQLAGRYPDASIAVPGEREAQELMARSREVFEWLRRKL